jgi:hypothetical protein
VLTINGKAELVVQDAEAYQALLDRVEAIEAIQRGLADVKAGRTKPARQAFARLPRQSRPRRDSGARRDADEGTRDRSVFERDNIVSAGDLLEAATLLDAAQGLFQGQSSKIGGRGRKSEIHKSLCDNS